MEIPVLLDDTVRDDIRGQIEADYTESGNIVLSVDNAERTFAVGATMSRDDALRLITELCQCITEADEYVAQKVRDELTGHVEKHGAIVSTVSFD